MKHFNRSQVNCLKEGLQHPPPPADGAEKRQFIGTFETAAGGQSLGEAGNVDAGMCAGEESGEVVGRGFSLHIAAGGEDDFMNAAAVHALYELADAQVFGADVIKGADASVENMIVAVQGASAFERENVSALLDDAEQRGLARGVAAELAAGGAAGEEAADFAEGDMFRRFREGKGQCGGGALGRAQEPQSNALRAARADAGETLQLENERADFGRVVYLTHGRARRRGEKRA